MRKKVVVSQALPAVAQAMLTEHFDVVLPPEAGQKAFEKVAVDADAIVLRTNVTISKEFLEKTTNLAIISRTGAGADNVDYDACVAKGVLVCNLPGINNISVAEHAVALLLSLAKSLPLMDKSIRETDGWQLRRKNLPREVYGKTVGVVGMGAIGSLTAQMCAGGFGMKVLAYDPYADAARFPDYTFTEDLEELFGKSDFVTLHLPSLPSTKHLVNAKMLRCMQPHGVIINCSRGDIIDTDALADALEKGTIGGAGLDVFEEEPLPPNHRLLQLPNLLATPHIAGLTKEAAANMSSEACRQVIEYFATGKPLWVYKPPGAK